jgi:hypothetical protein
VTAVDILTTTDLPKRITSLTIYNKDTAAKTVQVLLLDAGDSYLIVNAELQPGETLGYSEATQWYTGGQVASYALLNGSATETFSVANATADAHAMPKLQIESLFAPLASAALTGTPTVPTAAPGTNTTQISSTAFTMAAVAGIDIGAAIHAATNKATPVGADEAGIWDSVSGLLNRISFTNLAAYFSGLCSAGWNAATATALSGTAATKLPDIDVTQAAGALTVACNTAIYQDFRSATATDGTPATILCDPADLVIPDGATIGFTSGVAGDAAVIWINNAGTVEKGVVNLSGGVNLDESGVISTTAIGTGSDSAGVVYSTTARTNVAYKVVKRFRAVNTAGSWGDPSSVNDVSPQRGVSTVRLQAGNGYGSTNTAIRRFLTVVTNIGSDITYADSATLGASFTINSSGVYAISYTSTFGAQIEFGLSLNSASLSTAFASLTIDERLAGDSTVAANYYANVAITPYLAAGSVIRPHTAVATADGGAGQLFTITRVA